MFIGRGVSASEPLSNSPFLSDRWRLGPRLKAQPAYDPCKNEGVGPLGFNPVRLKNLNLWLGVWLFVGCLQPRGNAV
jgi:hypothetical protein